MQAVDLDSGENGDVRYELKKGHGELFRVGRKNGEISLRQNLEGHNQEYNLLIAAYDGGLYLYCFKIKYLFLFTCSVFNFDKHSYCLQVSAHAQQMSLCM